MTRKSDNLTNLFGDSTSQMGMQLVVPLLRNRGMNNAAAATESAAGGEIAARQLELQQTREQLLVNTATSYWRLVAAKQSLSVAASKAGYRRAVTVAGKEERIVCLFPRRQKDGEGAAE